MNDDISFGIGLGTCFGILVIAIAIGHAIAHNPTQINTGDNIMTTKLIYCKGEVVGSFFLKGDEKSYAESVPLGTKVRIDREADNPHDPHACRVIAIDAAGGEHPLGYIPGQVAPAIALFSDNGFIVTGDVAGTIGKRSMGNQPRNPAINLYATK